MDIRPPIMMISIISVVIAVITFMIIFFRRRRQRYLECKNTQLSFFTATGTSFLSFWTPSVEKVKNSLKDCLEDIEVSEKLHKDEIADIVTLSAYNGCGVFWRGKSPRERLESKLRQRLQSIRGISISNVKISRIPFESLVFFNDLKTLDMSSCELTDELWMKGPGSGFPALKKIILDSNKFRTIPDVSDFRCLVLLSLRDNCQLNVSSTKKVRLFKKRGKVIITGTEITEERIKELTILYKHIKFEK